jgi:hypothetical protein
MKHGIIPALMAAALIGLGSLAQAEEAKTDHSAHHPGTQATEAKKDESQGMGMGMGQMHAMMGECMKMHKDGKMCDQQTMEKCQKQMAKGDCMKMMKESKAETGKTKK